jgi:transposase
MSENNTLSRVPLGELDKEALIAIILEQREQIVVLTQQIKKLQVQLAKNSQNSGKPPSSDGFKKAPVHSLREKDNRNSGGQVGHEGHSLEQVEQPDQRVSHAVLSCPYCTTDLRGIEVSDLEKRQVFDIPPVCLEVTEHPAEMKVCPCCGEEVKAAFPSEVSQSVQYGSRLKAQAVYLNNYQLLPLSRICQLFGDLYGHKPSQALVLSANAECLEQSKAALAVIQSQLRAVELAHYDETGARVTGRLNWLHVVGTKRLTYYAVHPKRGQAALQDMGILPVFAGWAVHDAWASYFQFEACRHALCNAHHLRELQFILEQYQQTGVQGLILVLLDIKAEVENTLLEQGCLAPEYLADYEQRYENLPWQGWAANPPPPPPKKRGRKKQSPPQNLLDRLHTYKAAVLAFMYDFRVPFDNNLAERDLRMMKVKQKISGAFRTQHGADTFCVIRSYISTVRKQGGDVLQAIYGAFRGQPFMSTSPA